MKVLILGGTGAMGVHLVELLSNKGVDLYVTSRKKRQERKGVCYLQGDAKDIDFLQHILAEQEWDAIIDFMVYSTEEFKERFDLLVSSSGQYIFLSSSRVYAESASPLCEESPRLLDSVDDLGYLETDEYALAKARQEDLLQNSIHTNWTIVRPYITYSENRLQLGVLEKEEWLYRAMQGRTIVFSKDIAEKITTLTHGLDVAGGICSLIGSKEALGQKFHITTGKSIFWKDVLTIYLEVLGENLGKRPKVLLADMQAFMVCKPAKYQVEYDRLFDRRFDNAKIDRHSDVESFIDPPDGLRQCLHAFLNDPRFGYIDWRNEARKDRLVGERAALKEIDGVKRRIKYLLYRYVL